MNGIPEVSVIIPVYNPPLIRLEKSIASVLAQGSAQLELILVDDGSTYEVGSYLDGLSESDARLTVVHQKNQGASVARNIGMEHANAPYIMFVDSDDELMLDTIDNALRVAKATDADIVAGFSLRYYEDGRPYTLPSAADLNGDTVLVTPDELIRYHLTGRTRNADLCIKHNVLDVIAGAPVAMLVKSHIAKSTPFPSGVIICEDLVWDVTLLQKCKSVVICKTCWYRYYQYSNSSIHRYRSDCYDNSRAFLDALTYALGTAVEDDYSFEFDCRRIIELNRLAKNNLLSACALSEMEKNENMKSAYKSFFPHGASRKACKGLRGKLLLLATFVCRTGLNIPLFRIVNRLKRR